MFNTPKSSKYTLIQRRPTPQHKVAYVTGGLVHLYQRALNNNNATPAQEGEFTDDEGVFSPQPDMPLMASRYKFLRNLGKGQSSVLVKVQDMFAAGALRSVKVLHTHYSLLGVQESDCVRRINLADPYDTSGTLRLCNTFSYHGHYCMVFELLSPDPVTAYFKELDMHEVVPAIRKVSLRLLQAIGFLQQQNVIHADLKPANILLKKDGDLTSVKVVDFGNAIHCIHDELSLYYDDFELQTLLYRAPEVVYGLTFGLEVDMWSLGCVLAELYLNRPLFCGCDKDETLANMTDFLGPLPEEVFKRGKFYSDLSQFTSRAADTTPVTTTDLMYKLGCNDYPFVDFLRLLLHYNPHERMTVAEAARHSFLAPEIGFGYVMSPTAEQGYPPVLLDHQNYTKRPFIDEQRKRQRLSSAELLREGTSLVPPTGPKVKVAHVMPIMKVTGGSDDKPLISNNNNYDNNNSNNNNNNSNNNNNAVGGYEVSGRAVWAPLVPDPVRRSGQQVRDTSCNGYSRHNLTPHTTPHTSSTKVTRPIARYDFTRRTSGDKTHTRTSNHVKVERIERTLERPKQSNGVRPVTKVESPDPVRAITNGGHQHAASTRSNQPQSQGQSRSRSNEPKGQVQSRSNETQGQGLSRLIEPQGQRSNESQGQGRSRPCETQGQRSHEYQGQVQKRSYEPQDRSTIEESRRVSNNEGREDVEELHVRRISSLTDSNANIPATNPLSTAQPMTTQPVSKPVRPAGRHGYKTGRQTKTRVSESSPNSPKTEVLFAESSPNGTFIVQATVGAVSGELTPVEWERVGSSLSKRKQQRADKLDKPAAKRPRAGTGAERGAGEVVSSSPGAVRRQLVTGESDTDSCDVTSTMDHPNMGKHRSTPGRDVKPELSTLDRTTVRRHVTLDRTTPSKQVKQARATPSRDIKPDPTSLQQDTSTSPVVPPRVMTTPQRSTGKSSKSALNTKVQRPVSKKPSSVPTSATQRPTPGRGTTPHGTSSPSRHHHTSVSPVVSTRGTTPQRSTQKSNKTAKNIEKPKSKKTSSVLSTLVPTPNTPNGTAGTCVMASDGVKHSRSKPLARVPMSDSGDEASDSSDHAQHVSQEPRLTAARVPDTDRTCETSQDKTTGGDSVKLKRQKPKAAPARPSTASDNNMDDSKRVKINRSKPKISSAKVSTLNAGSSKTVKRNRTKPTQSDALVSTGEDVFVKTYQKTPKQQHDATTHTSQRVLPAGKSKSDRVRSRDKDRSVPETSVKNGLSKVLKSKSKQQRVRTSGVPAGRPGRYHSPPTTDGESDTEDDHFPTVGTPDNEMDASIWSSLPSLNTQRVTAPHRVSSTGTRDSPREVNTLSTTDDEHGEPNERIPSSTSDDDEEGPIKRRVLPKKKSRPRGSKTKLTTGQKSPMVRVSRKRKSTKQPKNYVSDSESMDESTNQNSATKRLRRSPTDSPHRHERTPPSSRSSRSTTPQSRPRRSVTPLKSYVEDTLDDMEDEVMLL